MKEKILIVEDQFVEADYLQLMLTQAGYTIAGIARSVPQAEQIIKTEKPDFVLVDIFLKGKQTGIDLAKQLSADNIPFVYLSANSNEEVLNAAKTTEPYGFLVKPFREKDLLIALEIAHYRHKHNQESKWQREKQLRNDLFNIEKEGGNWNTKVIETAKALQKHIPFDCMCVYFKPLESRHYSGFMFRRSGFSEYQTIDINSLSNISARPIEDIKRLLEHNPIDNTAGWYNGDEFKNLLPVHPMKAMLAKVFGFSSNIVLPFLTSDSYMFSLSFFRRSEEGYSAEHLDMLFRLQQPLIAVMNSISPNEKRSALSIHPEFDMLAPAKTAGISPDFGTIIGKSPALLNVMDLIGQVAYSDTSVLLLGESGTGKEKIADAIHNLSTRKNKPFVKVNCAALPPTLIESELFGHEKGAFTGALDKRIGKFEKADTGTILLDEIGEMPLELQVKLLRVLQEKEIERIGGRNTLKIDVRIIAATNKNLEKEVAEGRFRLDLYYRLNVFPIRIPPLRERKEDLPALAYHFMNHYNHKSGKKISGISDNVLKSMMAYDWPGNIRELEHLIERSVLLTRGSVIEDIQLPAAPKKPDAGIEDSYIKTIHENERDYIISILKKCNGRIWGAGAAAEILNIPPSTLKSRMKKLGIRKEFIP
ncbi:sigma 54-interacting response regulator [Chitinophaga filiformis]|uniref:Sigma 54-interacting response regulator n=1 Tax=Chitinophaga filiformis TaxID=104663 RepID=A0ABY4HWE9_CHIFI|nr:sigma 54-interacting response regulator [Chitinophaga filiformis]UPK68107.1 sigma 54-interacting response regulator [Chitinophaga filiformis]